MLIGNRDRFAIELTPVKPGWSTVYAPEAAAWAGFAVWVEGKNLAAHVRQGEQEVRECFYVPLAPIADWIAKTYAALALEERAAAFPITRALHGSLREWGRRPPPAGMEEDAWLGEREQFWGRHFLVASAEGARLPNIAWLREDDEVAISWSRPKFASPPPVTMLHAEGITSVSWQDVDAPLKRFVSTVVEWFGEADLPYRWMRETAPLSTSNVGWEDALKLFCGRSPAELATLLDLEEAGLLEYISNKRDLPASPLCQVARDLSPRATTAVGKEILSTVEASRQHRPQSCWSDGRALAKDAARAGLTPEGQGQLAARQVRESQGLNGKPVDDVPALLAKFGVVLRSVETLSEDERMLIAAADGSAPVATVLRSRSTNVRWGRRFEEARALGHALLDTLREGAFGAASSRWAQETRRRRSGAFAAELLLPETALEQASEGKLDGVTRDDAFPNLLQRYGVGARTAAQQLYNHEFLSSAGVRDDLIETFGKDDH